MEPHCDPTSRPVEEPPRCLQRSSLLLRGMFRRSEWSETARRAREVHEPGHVSLRQAWTNRHQGGLQVTGSAPSYGQPRQESEPSAAGPVDAAKPRIDRKTIIIGLQGGGVARGVSLPSSVVTVTLWSIRLHTQLVPVVAHSSPSTVGASRRTCTTWWGVQAECPESRSSTPGRYSYSEFCAGHSARCRSNPDTW